MRSAAPTRREAEDRCGSRAPSPRPALRVIGEARRPSRRGRCAGALPGLPEGVLLGLALKELAANLPSVGSLVLTPTSWPRCWPLGSRIDDAAPAGVVVHRRSEYDELLDRHGTRGQAEFFLGPAAARWRRMRGLTTYSPRHSPRPTRRPRDWRRGSVDESGLPRFLFEPADRVVMVGQERPRSPMWRSTSTARPVPRRGSRHRREALGVMTRRAVAEVPSCCCRTLAVEPRFEARTMVEATLDGGRALVALDEVYLGHAGHQSARSASPCRKAAERQRPAG